MIDRIDIKKMLDEPVMVDVPMHAERIIRERRLVGKWVIESQHCIDKIPTYTGNFEWRFLEEFTGDECDAIDRCFELKRSAKAGAFSAFRRVDKRAGLEGSYE